MRLPNTSGVTGLGDTENVFKANPGKGLARRSFKDTMTIGAGTDQVKLYYFGPAHTGGDAFVEFVADKVMHAATPGLRSPKSVRTGGDEPPRLVRCLVCPSADLFLRKDFPQRLGVGIVVVGLLASCVTWGMREMVATFASLRNRSWAWRELMPVPLMLGKA